MAQQKPFPAELLKPLIVDGIGTVLVVIALYSWFAEPLHPVLADQTAIAVLLVVGGLLMAWGFGKFFLAMRQRATNR